MYVLQLGVTLNALDFTDDPHLLPRKKRRINISRHLTDGGQRVGPRFMFWLMIAESTHLDIMIALTVHLWLNGDGNSTMYVFLLD